MEIKFLNPCRSGLESLKIKVEKHTTGRSNVDVMCLKQVRMRLSSVCVCVAFTCLYDLPTRPWSYSVV